MDITLVASPDLSSQVNTLVTDIPTLQQWLKERLNTERYEHSVGAQLKATELAQHFALSEEDQHKTAIAGLLHDAAKQVGSLELFDACKKMNLMLNDADMRSPQTIHPFVSAEMVKRELGITDPDILNAIRYHTTGRARMSMIEKLVFVADKIEDNTRNPLYCQKINQLIQTNTLESLDVATLYILDSTIGFLIEKGLVVHPRTLEARNDLLESLKDKHIPYAFQDL